MDSKGCIDLKCLHCKKHLMTLQLVTSESENNQVTTVVAKCCFCGAMSEHQSVVGKFYPGVPEDDMWFEPSMEFENGTIVFLVGGKAR